MTESSLDVSRPDVRCFEGNTTWAQRPRTTRRREIAPDPYAGRPGSADDSRDVRKVDRIGVSAVLFTSE